MARNREKAKEKPLKERGFFVGRNYRLMNLSPVILKGI
jgi:hypothetical protein